MSSLVQLANTYSGTKIAGMALSEKLDGTRAIWVPESRGKKTHTIPWAGLINPATGKPKPKVKPVATGLWSRYGNPIMAPDWFLDQLPPYICDGELWAGRGNFQLSRSICGGDTPDPRFDQIQFAVFGLPTVFSFCKTRKIKSSNHVCDIQFESMRRWFQNNAKYSNGTLTEEATFEQEINLARTEINWTDQVYWHKQVILPNDETEAQNLLQQQMENVREEKIEGFMLRTLNSPWQPKRVRSLLKVKKWFDDEGTVVGFVSGRETNRGSKLLGRIGALILDYQGKRLEINGLNFQENLFENNEEWAVANPGKDMPQGTQGQTFKVGDVVTFKYVDLTDAGIPRNASYMRKFEV